MDAHIIFKSKNFYLLVSLVLYFLCSPLLIDNHINSLLINILMAISILVCVNMASSNHATLLSSIGLATLTIIGFIIIFMLEPPTYFYIIHFTIIAIFLILTTLFVISSVAAQQEIKIDTILGAICGYLLIGLTWSYFFLIIASIDANAFSYHISQGTFRDATQHFIYLSFVTLTTLGYGDIVPNTDFARAASWLEAAVGQIFLAVWISQLVALHIAQRIKRNALINIK